MDEIKKDNTITPEVEEAASEKFLEQFADKPLTIEDVDKAWTEFLERADRAEQYQFMHIALWHVKLKPYFDDLHTNWNVHHANVFLRGINTAYQSLGWYAKEEV